MATWGTNCTKCRPNQCEPSWIISRKRRFVIAMVAWLPLTQAANLCLLLCCKTYRKNTKKGHEKASWKRCCGFGNECIRLTLMKVVFVSGTRSKRSTSRLCTRLRWSVWLQQGHLLELPVQSQSCRQLRCIFALQHCNDSPPLSRQMGQTPDWKEKYRLWTTQH